MYGPTETTIWSTASSNLGRRTNSNRPADRQYADLAVYSCLNLVPVGSVGCSYRRTDWRADIWAVLSLRRNVLSRILRTKCPDLSYRRYCALAPRRNSPNAWAGSIAKSKFAVTASNSARSNRLLNLHPGIRQCAVVVREDRSGNAQLAAYFETNPGQSVGAADLRASLEKSLPAYMIPSIFVAMEKLPLTNNGKIDRKSLPAPQQAAPLSTSEFVAPENPSEQMLARIWAKVLKVERVGRHDNFFELGGQSLLAVRAVVEIEKVTKVRLPLAMLLQAPTIAGLAKVLLQENWKPSWSSLVPIQPRGSKPPLFLLHAHGGNVLEYYPLASHLGPDQPVYAFQARGLDGHIAADSKLKDMAAAYITELRNFQPEGPYYLGGFCFGGLLALEVAQQLTDAGQSVALLTLIQSTHPDAWRFKPGTTALQCAWYKVTKRISLELDNLSHGNKGYITGTCAPNFRTSFAAAWRLPWISCWAASALIFRGCPCNTFWSRSAMCMKGPSKAGFPGPTVAA